MKIGYNEVYRQIRQLEITNKSHGCTNIPKEFIKFGGEALNVEIAEWCNDMFQTEATPDQMGESRITLLHKKAEKCFLANYRTLAVGCNLCQIYLRVLEARIRKLVEDNNLLGELQCGFRNGRRCQDNLLVIDTVIKSFKKSNKSMFIAFLDITKAYDRIPRDVLWKKLRLAGIPDKLVRVLEETYRLPRGKVVFQGVTVENISLPLGLKQGCVMSPILFALFIADLMPILQAAGLGPTIRGTHIPVLAFADDLAVMGNIPDLRKLLAIIGQYARTNAIEFAGEKSLVIPITRPVDPKRVWSLGNQVQKNGIAAPNLITEGESIRYLGAWIRRKTNVYQVHAEKMIARARAMLWFTNAVARETSASAYVASAIWNCYAKPAFTYALETCNISWHQMAILEKVQAEMCRTVLKLPRGTNKIALYGELGIRPVIWDVAKQTLCYYYHIMQLPDTQPVKMAVLEQRDLFAEKGWPLDTMFGNGELYDEKEFSTSKLWFKWVLECCECLGLDANMCMPKETVKDISETRWDQVWENKVGSNPNLITLTDRGGCTKVDPSLRTWGGGRSWIKARLGVSMPFGHTRYICPCQDHNGRASGEQCSLSHVINDCKELEQIRNDVQVDWQGLGRKGIDLEWGLHILRSREEREIIGITINKMMIAWSKTMWERITQDRDTYRTQRCGFGCAKTELLEIWAPGNRGGSGAMERQSMKEQSEPVDMRRLEDRLCRPPAEADILIQWDTSGNSEDTSLLSEAEME
jgi:hypothetical protein